MVLLTPFLDCRTAGPASLYLLYPFCQLRCVFHRPYVHAYLRLSVRFFGILTDSPRLYANLQDSARTLSIL